MTKKEMKKIYYEYADRICKCHTQNEYDSLKWSIVSDVRVSLFDYGVLMDALLDRAERYGLSL